MKIVNGKRTFTNQQLTKIINKLGRKYQPALLVICDSRAELLHHFTAVPGLFTSLFDLSLWTGKTEGFYLSKDDIVVVFTYSQTDDQEDRHSRQLYSIHALVHELYHRKQAFSRRRMTDDEEEQAADRFATSFVNKQSAFLAKVMGWKDQWRMWEEP